MCPCPRRRGPRCPRISGIWATGMKAAMLESPEDEPGVVTVTVKMSTGEQVQRVLEMLGSSS